MGKCVRKLQQTFTLSLALTRNVNMGAPLRHTHTPHHTIKIHSHTLHMRKLFTEDALVASLQRTGKVVFYSSTAMVTGDHSIMFFSASPSVTLTTYSQYHLTVCVGIKENTSTKPIQFHTSPQKPIANLHLHYI